MAKKEVIVTRKLGLHARAAMQVANAALTYEDTEVMMKFGDDQAPTKSVMNLLKMGAGQGAKVELHGEGPDADTVINEIELILTSKEED